MVRPVIDAEAALVIEPPSVSTAACHLTGANTIAAGSSLTNHGTLTDDGTLIEIKGTKKPEWPYLAPEHAT